MEILRVGAQDSPPWIGLQHSRPICIVHKDVNVQKTLRYRANPEIAPSLLGGSETLGVDAFYIAKFLYEDANEVGFYEEIHESTWRDNARALFRFLLCSNGSGTGKIHDKWHSYRRGNR